ncbi:MAG: hypothetical protein Q8S31_07065 [Alphaproteobacteria bacterium]|nr:hypothetical protein [Alphaproteobacteria bacterium]
MKKLSKILLMVGSVCMINTASFAADPPKATIAPKCMCIKAPCNCPDTKSTKKPAIKPNQTRGDQTVIAVPTPVKPVETATPSAAPKPSGVFGGAIPK